MEVFLITPYSKTVPFLHILPNVHIVNLETENLLFDTFFECPDQPDINHLPYRIVRPPFSHLPALYSVINGVPTWYILLSVTFTQ